MEIPGHLFLFLRKGNREGGTPAKFALGLDGPAMGFNDVFDDGQAQAGTAHQ